MVTGGLARPSARRLMLAFFAALMLVAIGAGAARAAQTEAPSDRLQVWNLNTHGMDTGSGPPPPGSDGVRTNYRLFLDYITGPNQAYYPDVVTLQEAGTASIPLPSCHQAEADLEARTGRNYYCVETTLTGGAAIVYNVDRLSRQTNGQSVQIRKVDGAGNCPLSSWYASTLRLKDDVSGKFVNVGSFHLPTAGPGTGQDCAWDNMKIISPAVTGLGSASMNIMAGDSNHPDATATNNNNTFSFWECWYQGVNTSDDHPTTCGGQNFGWKDPPYRACAAVAATEADRYTCLHLYSWTYKTYGTDPKDRRDFLFAKGYALYNQITVDLYPNPTKYSDHRGQGVLVKYY
jgi:hypothetical protein